MPTDPRRSPPADDARLVIAMGGFDGVHLGHRQVIDRARALAEARGGVTAVLTFDPLPAQLIHPDFTYVLTPLAEKTRILTELGVELIHVIRFDESVRRTPAEEFIRRHITEPLHPAAVVVGHDHRFGSNARGDADLLRRLLVAEGVELEIMPEFIFLGAPVRSTRIREHLLLGAVRRAAELLGRWYALSGEVVSGTGTGRKLGFPTINLRPRVRETLVPADGVYVCRVDTLNRRFDAVLNIGHRPTFGGETRTIEAHLIDQNIERQPTEATFHIIDRIRPERRFPSGTALSEQIADDVAAARAALAGLP